MVGFGLRCGWVRRVAALGCVVGLLSACGEAAEPRVNSADVDLDDEGTGAGQDGNSGDGGTTDAGTEPLAWVPFGPADPTNPTPSWPVYRHLAQGECSALESYLAGEGSGVGEFGTALVAVCRAAVDGHQDQWAVARSLKDADPSTLGNDCLAGVMTSLLDRAVEWHERNPGRRPDVAFSRVAGTTTCAADGDADSGTDGPEDTDASGADGPDDASSDADGSDGEGSDAEESDDDGSGAADEVSDHESEGDVPGADASEGTG